MVNLQDYGTSTKQSPLLALALLVPIPTLGTLAAMWVPATRGTLEGQSLYFLAKLWILIWPLFWWFRFEREATPFAPPKRGGLVVGTVMGLTLSGVIYVSWQLFGHFIDTTALRVQATTSGIDSPLQFLGLCSYLALVNSLLEEFVWRWFVYRKCQQWLQPPMATLLTAFFFTLHHVFALKAQLNWMMTLLGSLAVFTGSLLWSWCYIRYRSVWPGYLCHLIVDAALFLVGWQIIFP